MVVMVQSPEDGYQNIGENTVSLGYLVAILVEMLHDASGPTWRQTCFLPAAAPRESAVELTIEVLGRFRSTGGFDYRQVPKTASLHIVHAGEGFVRSGGEEWRVAAGGAFCFEPGVSVHYGDTREKPWRYTWIFFSGTRATELTSRLGGRPGPWMRDDLPHQRVRGLLDEIEAAFRSEDHSWFYPQAAAWRVLDALSPPSAGADRSERAAHSLRNILDAHFATELKFGGLAQQFGVDRSTLFRRFRGVYGCSPKQYLDRIRLEHAAALLRDGTLSVAEVAERCGYAGAPRFAKAFKGRFGTAPSRFNR
jgi:AraC-like DNA-binding protein